MAYINKLVVSGGGSGITSIQENGVVLPAENTLNFVTAGSVTVADNPGNSSTDVTFATNLNDIANLTPTAGNVILGNLAGTHFVDGTAANIKDTYAPVNYAATSATVDGNLAGIDAELGVIIAGGAAGPFTAGSVIFSNGTKLTQDNASLNWNDATYTLNVLQPSSLGTLDSVLVVTSDPAGAHGHGNHIEIAGNPGGGGTIFRTDGGLNKSVLQLYGGDSTGTTGGALYLNGNNSTSGDAGGVQSTFGLSTSTFDMYDYTQSTLLFQLNNSGVLKLPLLNTYSALATDGSSNVTAISSATAGYVLTSNGAGSAPTFQAPSAGFTVQVITTNTTLVPNTGYIVNGVGQLTLTLPSTFPAGAIIKIAGYAGGWTIVYGSGQNIIYGNQGSTITTGNLTASAVTNCVEIWAVAANLTFLVVDSEGQINVN